MISVLLTTHNRAVQFHQCLSILQKLNPQQDIEFLILDDYYKQLNIESSDRARYIWTGKTKNDKDIWRIPGFAYNIGAKEAKGDILIISCGELMHSSANLIVDMASKFETGTEIVTPEFVMEQVSPKALSTKPLNRKLPFFMAISKNYYEWLGGYDEDFTGYCFDDNDFADRAYTNGKDVIVPNTLVLHLWNPRGVGRHPSLTEESWRYNRMLYHTRKGILQRNVGREWGCLET